MACTTTSPPEADQHEVRKRETLKKTKLHLKPCSLPQQNNIGRVFQTLWPSQSQLTSVLRSEFFGEYSKNKGACWVLPTKIKPVYSHILRKPATLSVNNEYSISFGHLLTLLMSRFCGLRSRWRTFRLWQKARPFNNWYIKDWKERIKTALSDTSNIKNVIKRCSPPPLP